MDFLPINHALIFFQLTLAAILGGIIGLERELWHKPAGLRTGMLVCLGSALFTIISIHPLRSFFEASGYDPTRIISQIVAGIGFIGAGVIFHKREHIEGITTAATLWVTAAVGIAVGVSFYLEAVFVTLLVLTILLALGHLEMRYTDKKAKDR